MVAGTVAPALTQVMAVRLQDQSLLTAHSTRSRQETSIVAVAAYLPRTVTVAAVALAVTQGTAVTAPTEPPTTATTV